MSDADLHPEARALIEETKDAYAPSAAARARAHWALERRLSAPRRASGGVGLYFRRGLAGFAVLLAAGAAAAAVYLVVRDAPEPAPLPSEAPALVANRADTARASGTVSSERPKEAAVGSEEPKAADPTPAEVASVSAPAAPERAQDAKERSKRALASLEGEIELLREVNALRETGSAARALRMLDDYGKINGPGSLGQERAAARTLCLCALGSGAKNQDAAARFQARYPKSPQLPRVRAACGLEP